MKKILIGQLILLLMLAIPFNSCTDLEEEVFSSLTPENFPQNKTDIISAFAGAYTRLYNMGNHNSYMSMNGVASDELMIPTRGADWGDGGQWTRTHRHQYTPDEQSVNNAWVFLFQGVTITNQVISSIENNPDLLSTEEATLFTSEMRALRALFYWWLLDAYGSVPLVTVTADLADTEPVPASREELFNFVVSELQAAAPNLMREKSVNTYARFNYYSAQALLAKVLLNAEVYTGRAQWADAASAADEVINSNLYSLTDNYFDNFSPTNDNGLSSTSENILVIPYDQNNAQGFNMVQMTLHYSSQSTFDLQEQPWNGYCTVQEFYESYEDSDRRKGVWGSQDPGNFLAGPQFASSGDPLTDGLAELIPTSSGTQDPDGSEIIFTPEVSELEPNALRQEGARVYKYTYESGAARHMNNDYVLLRYADMLLVKAEALWRQNPADGMALMYVNQVRERAGVEPFGSLTEDNLLAERGREMFFENNRRQDLIRFGKYNDPWRFKDASDATKNIFPIPTAQLGSNRNLTQNPGY